MKRLTGILLTFSFLYNFYIMTIRKATAQDAKKLAPIMILAMTEIIYQFIGKEDLEEAILFLELFIGQEGNQYAYHNIYLAEEDQEILGQICLYDGADLKRLREPILSFIKAKYGINYDSIDETQAGEIYIDTIAVSPSAQGRGIGGQLLNFAIAYIAHQQQKTLGLLVEKSNPHAKKLYERVGFKVVDSITFFNKEMEHLQYRPVVSAIS